MTQNPTTTKDLMESFVDKLIQAKNFASKDPVVLAEIKTELLKRVDYHINAGLLVALPPEHLEKFDELLAAGNDEAIQNFLQRHIPDLQATIADILLDFKAAYLGA
jgi:hypothetical protein